eukprot:m.135214 g.135214  ORF g.135214 m.135214 type:complete len:128 (-) comp23901_c0_seq2:37-420(-)
MAHPCLNTIDEVLFPRALFQYTRRCVTAFFAIGVAFMIAMLVEDVSVVLGIAGATGSTSISFILPGLFFMRLDSAPLLSWGKGSAVALSVLGVAFFVISTVVTLLDAADTSDDLDLATKCNRTAIQN